MSANDAQRSVSDEDDLPWDDFYEETAGQRQHREWLIAHQYVDLDKLFDDVERAQAQMKPIADARAALDAARRELAALDGDGNNNCFT